MRARISWPQIDKVVANEPLIITRQNGEAVVMMSLKEFQSWEETAYLLNSPANARKLMKSLDEAARGKDSTTTHRTPTTLDGSGRRGALRSGIEYEGTSHFLVTASSAKIEVRTVNLQPLEGEAP